MPSEIGDMCGRRTSLTVSIVGMVVGAQVMIDPQSQAQANSAD